MEYEYNFKWTKNTKMYTHTEDEWKLTNDLTIKWIWYCEVKLLRSNGGTDDGQDEGGKKWPEFYPKILARKIWKSDEDIFLYPFRVK